ncbi:MAG: phytanoyl-CoA dioxygenase [Candidatus Latescibacteria bacterium]|nr:phytanoyl-CoA dioxygenase [Candidatus Latescibacterota bacterium]
MLSAQQIEQFTHDGILVVKNLLDEEQLDRLRQRADWVASGQAPHVAPSHLQVEPQVRQGEAQADKYSDSLRKMSHIAFVDEVFQAHARNRRILDCIAALLGPDIKLYQDQLFMKPPRIGSRQRYHQDQPLGFYVDPPHMVTCWAALDRATIENGCLWMLPGTHRYGQIPQERWEDYEKQALAGQLPQECPIELEAGDCSFHHGLILHSSRPNQTGQRRRGYATHYVSAHCRYTGPPDRTNDALLVRGHEQPGCI